MRWQRIRYATMIAVFTKVCQRTERPHQFGDDGLINPFNDLWQAYDQSKQPFANLDLGDRLVAALVAAVLQAIASLFANDFQVLPIF